MNGQRYEPHRGCLGFSQRQSRRYPSSTALAGVRTPCAPCLCHWPWLPAHTLARKSRAGVPPAPGVWRRSPPPGNPPATSGYRLATLWVGGSRMSSVQGQAGRLPYFAEVSWELRTDTRRLRRSQRRQREEGGGWKRPLPRGFFRADGESCQECPLFRCSTRYARRR